MKNLIVTAIFAGLLAMPAVHAAGPAAPPAPAPASPPAPAVPPAAPAEQLTVTQDPAALARTVEAYFKAHKIIVNEQPGADNTIVLNLPFSAGATPAFTIVINTESLAPNAATKQFTESGIYITLWTRLRVEPKQREAALEVINKWNPTRLVGEANLSETNEVRLTYGMKVLTGGGLPSADVLDAMWELVYNWQTLYPQLKPMLQPPPEPTR